MELNKNSNKSFTYQELCFFSPTKANKNQSHISSRNTSVTAIGALTFFYPSPTYINKTALAKNVMYLLLVRLSQKHIGQQIGFVNQRNYCSNCLSKKTKDKKRCQTCNGYHHTMLYKHRKSSNVRQLLSLKATWSVYITFIQKTTQSIVNLN